MKFARTGFVSRNARRPPVVWSHNEASAERHAPILPSETPAAPRSRVISLSVLTLHASLGSISSQRRINERLLRGEDAVRVDRARPSWKRTASSTKPSKPRRKSVKRRTTFESSPGTKRQRYRWASAREASPNEQTPLPPGRHDSSDDISLIISFQSRAR